MGEVIVAANETGWRPDEFEICIGGCFERFLEALRMLLGGVDFW